MRPRHAVILTLSGDGDCPLWSYLQSGTLPWLISFICHSYVNCRVCTQNSQSGTLCCAFANLIPYSYSYAPPRKSFSCNTYGSPRKCCKQKTYSMTKPFRCNTYKKQGVPPSSQLSFSILPSPVLVSYLPSSVRSSKFRIPQPLCLPLLRKLPGVYQQFPFWNSTCVLANPFPYPLSSFNSPPGGILWVAL